MMDIEKLKKYGIWLIVIVIVIIGLFSRLSDEEEKDKIRQDNPNIVDKDKKDDKDKKEKYNGEVTAYAVHVGYLSERNGNINTIITTYDSFKTYFSKYTNYVYDGQGNVASSSTDEITKKYKEDYFKEKALAVVYIQESSGSVSITDVKAVVKDETVQITYNENVPQIGTMDMSGYFIVAEVPNTVTTIDGR